MERKKLKIHNVSDYFLLYWKQIFIFFITLFTIVIIFLFSLILINMNDSQRLIQLKINKLLVDSSEINNNLTILEQNYLELEDIQNKLKFQLSELNSDDDIKNKSFGQIALKILIDPFINIQKSVQYNTSNRFVAVKIEAMAISQPLSIRPTDFTISLYIDKKKSESITADKVFSGTNDPLIPTLLKPDLLLSGWISFQIPLNAEIIGFIYSNGIFSAKLGVPPILE
ncbi:MAG: hypothetical protein DK305_000309 [Chloroflexi bacterium]|nr:MAG: hypothetical protein DK305_000309 [Chloroflexota bacterium]